MVSRIRNHPKPKPPQPRPATPTPRTTTPSAPARPDPLAVSIANGTTFSPVDRATVEASAAKALRLGADVPGRVQDGPTCGLYALGMVMDYWEKKNPNNGLDPLVQPTDSVRWDSHSLQPDTNRRLLDEAKAKGFTTEGEMFHADQLGALAESFGYKAKVTEHFTQKDLFAAIDRHHPALVAFDVDQQGNPGLFGGARAHWAVVEGHFKKDGIDYVVATHGWTGKEYVWKASDLMASVQQLNQSDFPGVPKDITGMLKDRLVEVTPK